MQQQSLEDIDVKANSHNWTDLSRETAAITKINKFYSHNQRHNYLITVQSHIDHQLSVNLFRKLINNK